MMFRLWVVGAVAWAAFELATEGIFGDKWPWLIGQATCGGLWDGVSESICNNNTFYAASKMFVPPLAVLAIGYGIRWARKAR